MNSHNHEEKHSHSHSHTHSHTGGKIGIAILLNIIITATEIVGGILSGSLALLSDAFHNLSDVFSLIVAFIAEKVGEKEADERKTYGYKRAEIIGALFNIITLFLACAYIVYEAVKRLLEPQSPNASLMIIIAAVGLVGNALSILILFKDSKNNLNMKSAFLHLLGDTFSSVAVIIIATILYFFPNLTFLDPIASFLIVIYIVKEALHIGAESLNVLMQGTPSHVNMEDIHESLKKQTGVLSVHHIHIWSLSSKSVILDAHIVVEDSKINESASILASLQDILLSKGIEHSTLQIEPESFNCNRNKH